ncbi:AEC family transporter [Lysinibacter sp. HNR]|uniref:AEC family transporter n=1 Tax=Lysinibacter sp. HNR TaxID=3031408 RepID=UPI00243570A6|nr:AEC family transporter [Lysinibacter sp. HNR]WGD37507.1 AEC family transporter [Lysinibacter sp. HNR]
MFGVLVGFSIIFTVIAVGFIAGKINLITPEQRPVLNRVAFYIATPALLFTVLSRADVHVLVSPVMGVYLLSVVIAGGLYLLLSRLFFPRPAGQTVIGIAGASYANTNNIGLPVALYVLGDPSYVAPVLLVQLLVMAPVVLSVLDLSAGGKPGSTANKSRKPSPLRRIIRPFLNPVIIASAAGILVSITGIHLPHPVFIPFEILGGAAIPLILLAFGVSLSGQRPLQRGKERTDVLVATAIKSLLMPATAWILGSLVFGLGPSALYAAVILAALPTAQNIYNFAATYRKGETVARDTVLLTTALALPVMLGVAWGLA